MEEQTKGRIVSALVPGNFLLGTELGDWYERNPYHKFNEGDILILRDRNIAGYGIRPVAVVNGYDSEEGLGKRRNYYVTMYEDRQGDILRWAKQNEVSQGVERIVSNHETHVKWNIENHFKRVPVDSIDEALTLYASREIEPQEKAA